MSKLLVDVANVYSRSRHAMATLSTSDGRPSGGVFGFIKTVEGIRRARNIAHEDVCLCWESGGKEARREIFEGYKADRPEGSLFHEGDAESLQHWAALSGMRNYSSPGREADDVICALADEGDYIISWDHDFFPLLAVPGVFIQNSPSEEPKDEDWFAQKHGYPAIHHRKVLYLSGDPSDAVTNVPRVGEATAVKILTECDWDLERAIEHPKIKPHEEIVRRNQQLIDPLMITEWVLTGGGERDEMALSFFFEHWEFKSMLWEVSRA